MNLACDFLVPKFYFKFNVLCRYDEATLLRQEFEQFHAKQVSERPLMAAPLYPPGKLLHLRRLPVGQHRPSSLGEAYEVGAVQVASSSPTA